MAKGRRSVLTTLLFTDIVSSTSAAEELGDRRWRELLARHNRAVRTALREHGGKELDTAGDGFFARFDAPAAAVRCACAAIDAVRELGIEIRAGVHFGECEVLDGKLSGVNVHAGARTMGHAQASEVLVTSSVRDLVRGAGFEYRDRGTHELRGIAGEWHLFEVTSVDRAPRPGILSEAEARARRDAIQPPPFAKRRPVRITALALAAVAVLTVGALGLARAVGRSSETVVKGCEVAQQRPIRDRSFNEAVLNGLTEASTASAIAVRGYAPAAFGEAAWARTIDRAVEDGCSLIVTVGDPMVATTVEAARRHPGRRFVVSDANDAPRLSNLLSIEFQTGEAAFQAGYVAAATTKTGTVGTFGGIPLKAVVRFMDSFTAGVLHHNRTQGTKVRVLGWNPQSREGYFVQQDPLNYAAFLDFPKALRISQGLVRSGADILMPVDGPTGGRAAGQAAAGKDVLLIGVDGDQFYAAPENASRWLTSVVKRYDNMVALAMGKVAGDDFTGGVLPGTLANRGVELAPFHSLGKRVPSTVREQLKVVKRGIAGGVISVDAADYVRKP